MHNSEGVISYSATISALVRVFQSLHYHQDLSSASLIGQATKAATIYERSLVHAYREEELGSTDIT